MPRKITASDRKNLIRLASEMPKGSPERKAILAGLKKEASPYISFDGLKEGLEALGIPVKRIDLDMLNLGRFNYLTVKINLELGYNEAEAVDLLAAHLGEPSRTPKIAMGRNHIILSYDFGDGPFPK